MLLFLERLVIPMNGVMKNGELNRLPNDPNNPERYRPTFSNEPGANWFDTQTSILYLLLKGDAEIIVKTQNVILVCKLQL